MRDDRCCELTVRLHGLFKPQDAANLMADYARGDDHLLDALAGNIRDADYYGYKPPKVEIEVRWI